MRSLLGNPYDEGVIEIFFVFSLLELFCFTYLSTLKIIRESTHRKNQPTYLTYLRLVSSRLGA